MILFKQKYFNSYLDLWAYLIYKGIAPKEKWFPGSTYFYVKAHLEEKFQRKFTHRELISLIKYTTKHASC